MATPRTKWSDEEEVQVKKLLGRVLSKSDLDSLVELADSTSLEEEVIACVNARLSTLRRTRP